MFGRWRRDLLGENYEWLKREESSMPSQLARFPLAVASIYQKAVTGDPAPPVEEGAGGYADWVIVAIHGLREYLNQPYRRLLDILQEMPGIAAKLGLSVDELPDFTTVCTRKQGPRNADLARAAAVVGVAPRIRRGQTIDATGFKRHDASRHYVLRVGYNFDDIKTTALVGIAIRRRFSTCIAR